MMHIPRKTKLIAFAISLCPALVAASPESKNHDPFVLTITGTFGPIENGGPDLPWNLNGETFALTFTFDGDKLPNRANSIVAAYRIPTGAVGVTAGDACKVMDATDVTFNLVTQTLRFKGSRLGNPMMLLTPWTLVLQFPMGTYTNAFLLSETPMTISPVPVSGKFGYWLPKSTGTPYRYPITNLGVTGTASNGGTSGSQCPPV